MRAIMVNEGFKQGENSLATLGVGKYKKIKDKLDKMYNDHMYLTYKIIDLDHIEIFVKKEYLDNMQDKWRLENLKYIMKYVEYPKYFTNEYKDSYTSHGYELNTHDLSVFENIVYFRDSPKDDTHKQKRVFDIGKFGDPGIDELGKTIEEALQSHYEPVWGFELIETIENKTSPNT
jgi:hypothetical protein